MRCIRVGIACAVVATAVSALVAGQMAVAAEFPTRPVRVIVPQPAGSSADFFARALGDTLGERWGVPVVVDNRPGAGGSIAMGIVARAPADGYTLAVTTEGTLAIIPHLYRTLPYDTFSDLSPVTRIALAPYVLVVNPAVPAKSVKELIALAKASPGTINFASGGNGTGTHLSGELFRLLSGTKLVHVPYKGATLGLTDVVGGQVQMMFVGLPPALGQIKAQRLRALGVTTSKRNALLPEVPTIVEGGLAEYEVAPWWGVVAPAQTPSDLIEQIRAAVTDMVRTPSYRQRLAVQGAEPAFDTPAAFRKTIKSDYERWGDVIKRAAVRIQ